MNTYKRDEKLSNDTIFTQKLNYSIMYAFIQKTGDVFKEYQQKNRLVPHFLIDLLGKQHWSLHLDDPSSNPSSIGVDKPRNVWFLFFSSLCNLFCWVLYVYLLITHVYLSPLTLYKASFMNLCW